jgi:hypothetical protein
LFRGRVGAGQGLQVALHLAWEVDQRLNVDADRLERVARRREVRSRWRNALGDGAELGGRARAHQGDRPVDRRASLGRALDHLGQPVPGLVLAGLGQLGDVLVPIARGPLQRGQRDGAVVDPGQAVRVQVGVADDGDVQGQLAPAMAREEAGRFDRADEGRGQPVRRDQEDPDGALGQGVLDGGVPVVALGDLPVDEGADDAVGDVGLEPRAQGLAGPLVLAGVADENLGCHRRRSVAGGGSALPLTSPPLPAILPS